VLDLIDQNKDNDQNEDLQPAGHLAEILNLQI